MSPWFPSASSSDLGTAPLGQILQLALVLVHVSYSDSEAYSQIEILPDGLLVYHGACYLSFMQILPNISA